MVVKEFIDKNRKMLGIGAIALSTFILGTQFDGCKYQPTGILPDGITYQPRHPIHGPAGGGMRPYQGSGFERRDR